MDSYPRKKHTAFSRIAYSGNLSMLDTVGPGSLQAPTRAQLNARTVGTTGAQCLKESPMPSIEHSVLFHDPLSAPPSQDRPTRSSPGRHRGTPAADGPAPAGVSRRPEAV